METYRTVTTAAALRQQTFFGPLNDGPGIFDPLNDGPEIFVFLETKATARKSWEEVGGGSKDIR